jgi:LAO/AO transport system kinase
VGQAEVAVAHLAGITILVLVPGMGDDIQASKAGIMEIADIFVINKSDHEGAERVEREIRALQSLATRVDNWTPPIVKTVATEGTGISELAEAIRDYEEYMEKHDLLSRRRTRNWETRLIEMLRDRMLEKARAAVSEGDLARYAADIAEHKRDPYSVLEEIAAELK